PQICAKAPNYGHRIIRPLTDLPRQVDAEPKADLIAALSVNHLDRSILARRCDDTDATLDGADQASPAGIIGVLAEEFDPSGDKKCQGLPAAIGNSPQFLGAVVQYCGFFAIFRHAHSSARKLLFNDIWLKR